MGKEAMTIPEGAEKIDTLSAWGKPLKAVVCENCDWQFLLSENQPLLHCPHCYQSVLVDLSKESRDRILIYAPELILTPTLSSDRITQLLQSFSSGSWFPPVDLKVDHLIQRSVLLYLPIWLVDSLVQATWEAEAGFNYQVLSHQDRFDDNRGGWSSQEVQETRVRWESRVGKLSRVYQNISVPALNEHTYLIKQLGQFDLTLAKPYNEGDISTSRWVGCLPSRSTTDAWPEAVLGFQSSATQECQQACRADHLRSFSWTPEFSGQNWTLLLMPVYSTFYMDDQGTSQPILINGQTGKLSGLRRASLKRAQKTSLLLVGVAVLIFLLGLFMSLAGAVLPFLLVLGGIGIALAFLVGLSALLPLMIVWRTNRKS